MFPSPTEMNPIAKTPIRDPYEGEQTFLTYNQMTAAWDIVRLELGDQLDVQEFSIGVTHWLDLITLEPDDVDARRELREAAWQEESAC